MSVEIQVSDRVVLHDAHVYAETERTVFRKEMPCTMEVLRLGDQVREGMRIRLADGWERFPTNGPLPECYLESIACD